MKIELEKIELIKEDILNSDRTNPYLVASLLVRALASYNKDNEEEFFSLLQLLLGDYQPLSNLSKQSIHNSMMQNDKYPYIGKSYFDGAIPSNDYEPCIPYSITITLDNNFQQDGYLRLFLKSGGADSLRPVMLRLAKDSNYYIWSDSYMGLISDIRIPESNNVWQ